MPSSLKADYNSETRPGFINPAADEAGAEQLERAVGSQIRAFRKQLRMTAGEVAKQAGLSQGMLSKIERGVTAPSLGTLYALARALNVPVTSLFRKYEEQRDCSFVKSGKGLLIERRGTRAGHQYQLLGHNINRLASLEPYLITLTDESEVFPLFQHTGIEFIYLLEGEVRYRHGNETYLMRPGDSLFFDSDAPHGPEELIRLPIRMLACIYRPNLEE